VPKPGGNTRDTRATRTYATLPGFGARPDKKAWDEMDGRFMAARGR